MKRLHKQLIWIASLIGIAIIGMILWNRISQIKLEMRQMFQEEISDIKSDLSGRGYEVECEAKPVKSGILELLCLRKSEKYDIHISSKESLVGIEEAFLVRCGETVGIIETENMIHKSNRLYVHIGERIWSIPIQKCRKVSKEIAKIDSAIVEINERIEEMRKKERRRVLGSLVTGILSVFIPELQLAAVGSFANMLKGLPGKTLKMNELREIRTQLYELRAKTESKLRSFAWELEKIEHKFDNVKERKQVRKALNHWVKAIRKKNIKKLISCYADHMTRYFNRQNVSKEQVRRAIEKWAEKYSKGKVQANIRNVEIDIRNGIAIVTLDKEWDFRNAKRFAGEVKECLKLRKIKGKWKIFYEEELEVYWVIRE